MKFRRDCFNCAGSGCLNITDTHENAKPGIYYFRLCSICEGSGKLEMSLYEFFRSWWSGWNWYRENRL
jgi:hypothetical protein